MSLEVVEALVKAAMVEAAVGEGAGLVDGLLRRGAAVVLSGVGASAPVTATSEVSSGVGVVEDALKAGGDVRVVPRVVALCCRHGSHYSHHQKAG